MTFQIKERDIDVTHTRRWIVEAQTKTLFDTWPVEWRLEFSFDSWIEAQAYATNEKVFWSRTRFRVRDAAEATGLRDSGLYIRPEC